MSKIFKTSFFVFFILIVAQPSYANQAIEKQIDNIKANVIFIRHTLAPGYGDPENFNLQDCLSQRNLDKIGKKQAQLIGQYFIKNKISFTEILTSEWCRCIDTAREMNIGISNTFDGLNSFFQDYSSKSEIMHKLNLKLNKLNSENFTLMITHQVVISEVTNIKPPSGGIVLYNSNNKTALEFKIIDLYE